MSSTGVRKESNSDNRIIRGQIDDEKLFVESLKPFISSSISGQGGSGGSSNNSGNGAGNYLPLAGGAMRGPFGNELLILTIESDQIEVSEASQNDAPYIVLNPEFGLDDDLVTIIPGTDAVTQREMWIEIVNKTITFKTTGNISTPGSVDFPAPAGTVVKLIFSNNLNGWVIVGASNGIGGSGQTNPEIRPRVDHGTVGLATIQIDLSVPGGNFHKMILNDDISLAFDNPPSSGQVQRLILEIKQDGTGGHDVLSWGTLVNPPTLDTSPNGYTRIEIYTDDNGSTYEALSVTTGTGGDFMNRQMSNMDPNNAMSENLSANDKRITFQDQSVGSQPIVDFGIDDTIVTTIRLQSEINNAVGIQLKTTKTGEADASSSWTQGFGDGAATVFSSLNQLDMERAGIRILQLKNVSGTETIRFFSDSDNSLIFKVSPGVINIGEINSIIFRSFGNVNNDGKSISNIENITPGVFPDLETGGIFYDLEHADNAHVFRGNGATPSKQFQIADTEVITFKTFLPSNDGAIDIGSVDNSFSKINADMIAFRHNDGILSDIPSIGRNNNELKINSPLGKTTHLQIGGFDSANIDPLGLVIPALKRIQFNATNNASILKIGSDALNITSLDGILMESGAGSTVPQIVTIRGDFSTVNGVPAQIVFQGDDDAGSPTDYGSIRCRIGTNFAMGRNSSLELYSFTGDNNQLQLELDGLNEVANLALRLQMAQNQQITINDQFLEFTNSRATPGASGNIRRFFSDINNSHHASIATPTGIIDLETNGGSSNFSLPEVIQTSTSPPSGSDEDIYITNTSVSGGKLTIGAALLPNAVYCFPIIIGKAVTAKEIKVYVITGQTSPTLSRVDLGIYDSRTDGAIYPETLLDSATNILAGSDDQFITGSVNVALSPGLYWLAMVIDNTGNLELQAHDGSYCHSVGAFEAASTIENITGFLDQGQSSLLSTFADGTDVNTSGPGGQLPAIYLRCE